jgi:hypothetical protein
VRVAAVNLRLLLVLGLACQDGAWMLAEIGRRYALAAPNLTPPGH